MYDVIEQKDNVPVALDENLTSLPGEAMLRLGSAHVTESRSKDGWGEGGGRSLI